jgi:sugar (pentulose or hexulose) kinase
VKDELTLVIDIGKSHAKLLMFNDAGEVVERHGRDNRSVPSALGYPALDVQGLEDWMSHTLGASPNTVRCSRVMTSTHGAALVGLDETGLAWAPLDYEFDALAKHPVWAREFEDAADAFAQTLSPDLPAGLNAARQLFYVQHAHPQVWQRTRHLLPYPQYWAWRLCGERASEVSSLGCHTHLWLPQAGEFSQLASRQGWAALFAPVRSAWEVLGTVRPQVFQTWGLPLHCVVHAGVHDSNACLARYLESLNRDATTSTALTVVSSGTWTVLMAPGASTQELQAERDMLANVDVLGRATPTARFMGGREFECLLVGADPEAGSLEDLQSLISGAIMALPSFAAHGGPFRGREGSIQCGSEVFANTASAGLAAGQRAALAALYCAQTTAWLVERLWSGSALPRTVLVEGPLARNALYLGALQGLMPAARCLVSLDPVEGTARGAWMLSRCGHSTAADVMPVEALSVAGLSEYHAAWQRALV